MAATSARAPRASSALARDLFSVLALEGVYLCITPFPEYKRLFESLGFEPVPGTHTDYWGPDTPNDGYILDLQKIGIEAWFEAITAGRKPRLKPTPSELEPIIQEILRSWHDDASLRSLASRLKNGNVAAEDETVDPASIRQLALTAFERACAEATPKDALAYQALKLAYMQPGTSHERLAERLHVSRATYFRLLKRAVRGIAEAW